MTQRPVARISAEELAAEGATALPDKEVLSLLDLNADIDLALDAAAPIDLAIGANANIAAPIDAAASANVLSPDAVSAAQASQGALIHQGITGDATAHGIQDSTINQGASTTPDAGTAGTAAAAPDAGTSGAGTVAPDAGTTLPSAGDVTQTPVTQGTLDSSGNLLDVNVNLDGNLDLAAPIDGAVAANVNAAAPIDAAVSANIGSPGAESVAVADQTALIDQSIDGNAGAVADQVSGIDQGPTTP